MPGRPSPAPAVNPNESTSRREGRRKRSGQVMGGLLAGNTGSRSAGREPPDDSAPAAGRSQAEILKPWFDGGANINPRPDRAVADGREAVGPRAGPRNSHPTVQRIKTGPPAA